MPFIIEQCLLYLGMTMMPVAMFIVGITILVMVVLIQLDKVDLMAKVSVFESAVPPMVTAGIMVINARLAPALVTAMIAYGTMIAFITLPLLYGLLAWLFV